MRAITRFLALSIIVFAPACEETLFVDGGGLLPPPVGVGYQLEPSGDSDAPLGILLFWDASGDPNLAEYRVYSRGSTGSAFGLRGATSSNSFHDNGVPHLQYYVVAVDLNGAESAPSQTVTVDERLQLARPSFLASVSLDQAVHLQWGDEAFAGDPARFAWYRVYSASYDLDQNLCGATWSLEGTTVAPEFLVSAITNGTPRCFGVSAVSVEGYESLWSPLRQDTPRPDARNVLVWAYGEDPTRAGFRFWQDVNADGRAQAGELGLVLDGNRTDIDFWVHRDVTDSSLWIVPEFAGTSVRLYQNTPIADLTSIDYAPASGYGRSTIEAVPTYGYVFEIVEGNTVRYGALRVTHVGRDYLIFDWSFQSDPGNPELQLRGNLPTVSVTGFDVKQ
jgi:hypothetical protein